MSYSRPAAGRIEHAAGFHHFAKTLKRGVTHRNRIGQFIWSA
jgi:hypothetical protein